MNKFCENCAGTQWFCSATCAAAADGEEPDGVFDYARSVTFCGLLDLCHRDVIREADGLAMMGMWRINMIRFWNGHHHEWVIACWQVLCVAHMIMTRIKFLCDSRREREVHNGRHCERLLVG